MHYTFSADLVQLIVQHLNAQAAGAVRPLLNAIEAECRQQDESAAAKAKADEREAIKAELAAAVQTPAPGAAA